MTLCVWCGHPVGMHRGGRECVADQCDCLRAWPEKAPIMTIMYSRKPVARRNKIPDRKCSTQ